MGEKFKTANELHLLRIIEDQQKEHIKLMERVRFIISHGLRQPISQIIGIAQLINENDSRDELEQMHNFLKHSAENLDKMTRDLMCSLTNNYQYEVHNSNMKILSKAS